MGHSTQWTFRRIPRVNSSSGDEDLHGLIHLILLLFKKNVLLDFRGEVEGEGGRYINDE